MSLDKPKKTPLSAAKYSFALAAARYNNELVDALLDDTVKALKALGTSPDNIKVVRVPGSGELPNACGLLAESNLYDAVIALGVVVKGATPHFEIIAHSTAHALQSIAVATTVPVINGIIVANTRAQAVARTTGKIKRGAEFAQAAVEMAVLDAELLEDIPLDDDLESLN